jgi:site-specific DNA-methyltransferase (adenine-specific)
MNNRTETIADGVVLHLGDCREILPTLGKIGAVVTDPPYGIGHKHSGKARGKWNRANTGKIVGDEIGFDPLPILIAPSIIFGADHFAAKLPEGGVFHIWDKECGRTGRFDSFSDAEIFWTSWAPKRVVIRYMWKGLQVEEPQKDQIRMHPTQKPIEVMRQCIRMTDAAVIADPFMGTGTTGVAAVSLGRKFVGIEIEPRYFDIACKRIEDATKQADLFIDKPKPAQQISLLDTNG